MYDRASPETAAMMARARVAGEREREIITLDSLSDPA
jgi:hypothetical protein